MPRYFDIMIDTFYVCVSWDAIFHTVKFALVMYPYVITHKEE
jgi:hypothetical protein